MTAITNGNGRHGGRTEAEEADIVERYRAGETLAQIGATLGVSRERVRQLIQRYEREHGVDAGSTRIARILKRAQRSVETLQQRKVERAEEQAYAAAELLASLRRFYEVHGRAPTAAECGAKPGMPKHPDTPWANLMIAWFGSWREAFRLAGVPNRPCGMPGHLSVARRPGPRKHGRPIGSTRPDDGTLGGRIAAARIRAGLTQAQLGATFGATGTTVSNWEANRSEPRASALGVIARALGVSPTDLLPEPEPIALALSSTTGAGGGGGV